MFGLVSDHSMDLILRLPTSLSSTNTGYRASHIVSIVADPMETCKIAHASILSDTANTTPTPYYPALQAACMILRIDDIVSGIKHGQKQG